MNHVDICKILVYYQHAFRNKHSYETQLVNTVEEFARRHNDHEQHDLLMLDFFKAFSTVAHHRLLENLLEKYYRIRGSNVYWMRHWLTGRSHYCGKYLNIGFQSTRSHFLELGNITLLPNEYYEDLYQGIMAFFECDLLTANGNLTHHGESVDTLENTIVVLWLKTIHPGLPSW